MLCEKIKVLVIEGRLMQEGGAILDAYAAIISKNYFKNGSFIKYFL